MITIFHLTRSRSERIVWLMEELGLEYRLEIHPREATSAAPAALRDIHAIGKAPIIRDGDTVLAESGAIVEYLVQRHGKGRLALPPDSPDYARYVYWMHFAEGSLMSLMLMALVLSRVPEAKDSPVRTRLLVFPFTTMRRFLEYDLSPYANIGAYLGRIEARPAFRKAMALAGPDA